MNQELPTIAQNSPQIEEESKDDLGQLEISLEPRKTLVKEEVKGDEDSSDLDVTDDEETIETKRKKNELKTWRSQEVNFE